MKCGNCGNANDADCAFSLAVDVIEFLTKLEDELPKLRRKGVVEGEDEFARWIDRKGAIILDSGEDEKAVNALQRYRMGRGW